MGKILVGCEFSQIVTSAFREAGHEAYSCDILETEGNPEYHLKMDILEAIKLKKWDLGIFHPTCTYLSNSGVRHLHSVPSRNGVLPKIHGQERWQKMREAAEFFKKLLNCDIPRIAIENPVPHRYAVEIIGRKYDQIVRPYEHGHSEDSKAICLWLKNLPKITPTNIVPCLGHRTHMMGPSKDRWKERSRFFSGVAKAMAEQWGKLL